MSQIGIMYLICGAALFFYVSKVPEIWFPGNNFCFLFYFYLDQDFFNLDNRYHSLTLKQAPLTLLVVLTR